MKAQQELVRESKVYVSKEEAEVVAKAHLNQHKLD